MTQRTRQNSPKCASKQSKRRFAFVANAHEPLAAWRVLSEMQKAFPDHATDVFVVSKELRRHKISLAKCVIEALFRNPTDIIRGRKRLKDAVFRTSTVEKFIKGLIRKRILPGTHDFVFQMQSLYSASAPGVPHYIYTDHTNHTHSTYPEPDFGAIYGRDFRARERRLYQTVQRVFTRSTNISDTVINHYGVPPKRVQCVFAGANTEGANATSKALRVGRPENVRILFVGMDWIRKGGPDLVKAFQIIHEQQPNVRLTIAGCTPEALPSDLPIEVLGRVKNEDLPELYCASDIFCMPTLREPFGIVFIEAMTFGLPIVATRIGAIPDFVRDGETGYLVSPRSPDKLAEKLYLLSGDPVLRQSFGQAGAEIARDTYNWPNTVRLISDSIKADIANSPT